MDEYAHPKSGVDSVSMNLIGVPRFMRVDSTQGEGFHLSYD